MTEETKETKIQSFSVKRIVWPGIVIIIIGLFVLYSQQTASQKSKHFSSRHLSGIFKLPADGRIVNKDKDGQELWYKKGERVRFRQLGSPGKFVVINQKIPSLFINRPVYTTGRAHFAKRIELRARGGKEVIVQVRIIRRS